VKEAICNTDDQNQQFKPHTNTPERIHSRWPNIFPEKADGPGPCPPDSPR
jgi:hypothetical protein